MLLEPADPEEVRNVLEAVPQPGAPHPIGFARAIAATATAERTTASLSWKLLPDGANIAALRFASPSAKRIRLGMTVTAMPRSAILRFYAPDSASAISITGSRVLETLARNLASGARTEDAHTYWSAPIVGDSAVVEIEVPPGVATGAVQIAFPRLVHLLTSLQSQGSLSGAAQPQTAPLACDLDINCYSAWISQGTSVARMEFVVGSGAYVCTGTLLSDLASSYAPYFLTANHCISDQTTASTLTTDWFYRSTSCGGAAPTTWTSLFDGAALLYHTTLSDTSFLRLLDPAPAGALFAGWWAIDPANRAGVTDISHPRGDLQKIAFGASGGDYSCSTCPANLFFTPDPNGSFVEVSLNRGLTEPGSSGSALLTQSGSSTYVVGQLYGGPKTQTCGSVEEDYFGRFDVAYNAAISAWLGATRYQPLNILEGGTGTGLVTSDPPGVSCGSTCSFQFPAGMAVALSAVADPGFVFSGWSGSGCTGTSTCKVDLSAPASVTANFSRVTTLEVPWFTEFPGYVSRFVLMNPGITTGYYNISVATEQGNSASVNSSVASGAVQPQSELVIDASDLVTRLSTEPRAAALINVSGAPIAGIYDLVQPATGSITNTRLLPAADFASTASILEAPFVSTSAGYSSDFVFSNFENAPATAQVTLLPSLFLGQAASAPVPNQTSFTIPAQSVLDVPVGNLVSGAPGLTAALFSFNAPEGAVKGVYKTVSSASGAVSTTELLNPRSVASATTTLVVPWFTEYPGYTSRFFLINRSGADAEVSVQILTETGNSATAGPQGSFTIPAMSQLVLPASLFVSSFSGPTRGAAVFTIDGSSDQFDGLYQVINANTGAVSNTPMVSPSGNLAGSTPFLLPWFTTYPGYVSRFVFVNRSTQVASFTVQILPETGNNATQLLWSGTIPAQSMFVLNASDVVSGFTGATRAAAVFTIYAVDADIDALYNVVNPASGVISNTLLTH